MRDPKVSFVVPCYRLAHVLGDCVSSMLSQTREDLEVLIMDDCSPDDTPGVARSFHDRRVKHIRNEKNLKHLANYNKGISLARGDYIWLISADDRLRRPYIVERYVRLMDAHPEVGYVFCPAMRFRGDVEFAEYGGYGEKDAIFGGRKFLRKLLEGNGVCAPAGMVRRTAYERVGMFPLDLPFAGDWWLWCALAFHSDVGYFAEPMVGWRDHELNMTKVFKERAPLLIEDEFRVLWRVHGLATGTRDVGLARACRQAIARRHAMRIVSGLRGDPLPSMTVEEFEASLARYCSSASAAARIRADVYGALGDYCYDTLDIGKARQWYQRATGCARVGPRTRAKYVLARMGKAGKRIRDRMIALRHGVRPPRGPGEQSRPAARPV